MWNLSSPVLKIIILIGQSHIWYNLNVIKGMTSDWDDPL